MTTETHAERRVRQLAQHDDTHDTTGLPIQLTQTQDAEGDHCGDCGRSIYVGHVDPLQNTQPHNHALDCSSYEPHPASIAAQND